MKIYTLGVYGKSEEDFFNSLTCNNISTFVDIRQRRGVRGSQYKFVNSKYLQTKLAELGIAYLYEQKLAPTKAIREKQWAEDKAKGQTKKFRDILGNAFSQEYCNCILSIFDIDSLVKQLENNGSENIVLFCVESIAAACHRSLVASELNRKFGFEVINI